VFDSSMRPMSIDVIGAPPVHGTTAEWVRCTSVTDVPADAIQIQFAAALWGPGTVWMDGFEIGVVPPSVPTTDDGNWSLFTPFADRFAASLDAAEVRNGHATVCLHSDGGATPKGGFGAYLRRVHQQELDQYIGRRMRITAWMKCEDVTDSAAGLFATATQNSRVLARYGNREKPPLKGTLGWMRYSAEMKVPRGVDSMELGVVLQGSGKVWIDDVKIEAVDAPVTATKRTVTTTARKP
jgi:hypothetical protein